MSSTNKSQTGINQIYEYLCVDEFIDNFINAQSLKTALAIGLIDYLQQSQFCDVDTLTRELRSDRLGLELLLDMLLANQVITEKNSEISLSEKFLIALQYRDLLETKLNFANLVAPDFVNLLTFFINKPSQFMERSQIFDMFGYHRCFDYTPENYELTKRWMKITTVLTKYEAQVCLEHHDFSQYQKILDIGGNSGEFARQICAKHSNILATVFDLPLVCHIGEEYISSQPECQRINFIKGNAMTDNLPRGYDLVSFKSMLHDWPENIACQFINKAVKSLNPGGTLLIFERSPIELVGQVLSYSMLPMVLFFRSFRSPLVYESQLLADGLQNIHIESINLEMPFFLITAKKKNSEI
ncbi:methyltransferase [Anabaena azotica]|uniref:methyltransferase n=1 Tax=Anabaena azotica TaxID=197653 RepID=UPI0039A459D2